MQKYGNDASKEELPKELLLGQNERLVEYDRVDRLIKGLVCMDLHNELKFHFVDLLFCMIRICFVSKFWSWLILCFL